VSDTFIIALPYERPPLHGNQKVHWAVKAKHTRELRGGAAASTAHVPPMVLCQVLLTWFVTDRRRRDADNLMPTLKPLCDGLVDSGIVPDDTSEFMDKLMPKIILLGKGEGPARMELKIVRLK
jgi:crossover junction endodeoxyribonuclease RusA